MASKPKSVSVSKPTAPSAYKLGSYASQYGDRIDTALDTVTNWSYNPLKDASYQAMAKVYGARGNQAAKNTLADAASLNGGYGTSFAVSAAQQARNQYNQELAALIPDLEANAFNRATTTLGALRDADDTAYGRFRDSETDRQWLYSQNYQKYRDKMADYQWGKGFNYTKYRDSVADKHWAKEYAQSKKGSSGGGGRSSRGGGGGGYSGGSSYGGSTSTKKSATVSSTASARSAREHMNKMSNADLKKNGGKEKLYR